MPLGKSLMYTRNNNGPKIEPCSTTYFISVHFETVLELRYELMIGLFDIYFEDNIGVLIKPYHLFHYKAVETIINHGYRVKGLLQIAQDTTGHCCFIYSINDFIC